jgi:hypothetical protein
MRKQPSAQINEQLVRKYYRDSYQFGPPDTETKLIAEILCALGPARTWIDLGSGPTGPLWVPFVRPDRAILADLNKEHLAVAQSRLIRLRSGEEPWPVERDAAQLARSMLIKRGAVRRDIPGNPWAPEGLPSFECIRHDNTVLDPHMHKNPAFPEDTGKSWSNSADLVTMIGCLGNLPTLESLRSTLLYASSYLEMLGHLVFVEWLREKAPDRYPARFDSAPSLYTRTGVDTGIPAERHIETIRSTKKLIPIAIYRLKKNELSCETLQNGTSEMLAVVCQRVF